MRPVRTFAITGNQDHYTFGLGGVGWQPEGEEAFVAGLEDLLAVLRQLALQPLGLVLAALADRRAFHGGLRLVLGGLLFGMNESRRQESGGQ